MLTGTNLKFAKAYNVRIVLETIRLFEQGAHMRAGLYVAATLVLCLVAALGGIRLARALA